MAITLIGLDLLVSDLLKVPPSVMVGGVVFALAAAVAVSVARHQPATQQQQSP